MQHLMLQASQNGSPYSSIEYVKLAGSGAEEAAIDRYGLQLQFGIQEADVQTALLHYSIFKKKQAQCEAYLFDITSTSTKFTSNRQGSATR